MRILFVGNSHLYFNDLPGILSEVAASNGRTVEQEGCFGGGWTFADHVRSGEAPELIEEGGWDAVVLQASGTEPLAYEDRRTLENGKRLAEAVNRSGAQLYWFMAQAYDPTSSTVRAKISGLGRRGAERLERMTDEARGLYETLAREGGGTVVPVALAWDAVLKGEDAVRLHAADGYHPNPDGSMLGALVLYRVLFGEFPEEVPAGTPEVFREVVEALEI